jgi:hypothetical protein
MCRNIDFCIPVVRVLRVSDDLISTQVFRVYLDGTTVMALLRTHCQCGVQGTAIQNSDCLSVEATYSRIPVRGVLVSGWLWGIYLHINYTTRMGHGDLLFEFFDGLECLERP